MNQTTTGLTSVTFRQKTAAEIIRLAKEAGLDGIEWGGDIHVPAGDTALAEDIARQTREAGLQVLSYGSYYKAGTGMDFTPVLASAKALGAPVIRIWAGVKTYEESTDCEIDLLAEDVRHIADAAAAAGIEIAFEYHRGTATQTKEGAVALLQKVGHSGVGTYWQPNPDISQEEQLAEIDAVLPWLKNIHVFQWSEGNARHPLNSGLARWEEYLSHALKNDRSHSLILEFVPDDSIPAFHEAAETLLKLVRN